MQPTSSRRDDENGEDEEFDEYVDQQVGQLWLRRIWGLCRAYFTDVISFRLVVLIIKALIYLCVSRDAARRTRS